MKNLSRTFLCLVFLFLGCGDSENDCKKFCVGMSDCGLLPSALAPPLYSKGGESYEGKDTRSLRKECEYRCDATFGETTICPATEGHSSFSWRTRGENSASCHEIAACAEAISELPNVVGTAEVLLSVQFLPASQDPTPRPELEFDDACPAPYTSGDYAPLSLYPGCSDVQGAAGSDATDGSTTSSDDKESGTINECSDTDSAEPSSTFSDSLSTYFTALGVTDAQVRVRSHYRSSDWVGLNNATATTAFPIQVAGGPAQAELRLTGVFGDGEESPVHGPYCWIIRSPELILKSARKSGETNDEDLYLPSSPDAFMYAIRDQRDASAKHDRDRDNPAITIFACEQGSAACLDGLDNDADDLVDCQDPECEDFCDGREADATTCRDGLDNDGDALFDCNDPGCAAQCEQSFDECRNGSDDDGDGADDCAAPGCQWLCERAGCGVGEPCPEQRLGCDFDPVHDKESDNCTSSAGDGECDWLCGKETLCGDGRDNDGDELVDCDDPDCCC